MFFVVIFILPSVIHNLSISPITTILQTIKILSLFLPKHLFSHFSHCIPMPPPLFSTLFPSIVRHFYLFFVFLFFNQSLVNRIRMTPAVKSARHFPRNVPSRSTFHSGEYTPTIMTYNRIVFAYCTHTHTRIHMCHTQSKTTCVLHTQTHTIPHQNTSNQPRRTI